MRVKESKFGAPVGLNYRGKFLGIQPFKGDGQPRLGRDGKPMGPAVEWQFEITEDPDHAGANIGQIVGRITQDQPTTKNSCGILLSGLIGRPVTVDDDIEPGDFVGFIYQLVIDHGKENPDRTQVVKIQRVKDGPTPAAPRATALPPRPAAPPPRSAVAPSPPPSAERFVLWDGTREVGPLPGPEITEFYKSVIQGPTPQNAEVIRVRRPQDAEWKELKEYHLDEPF